jgi:hypothetical protein
MNVQITDNSNGNYINITERHPGGTVTRTGYVNNGQFDLIVVSRCYDGYESRERVTGYEHADGSVSNVRIQVISEQLPYAPEPQHYRSMELQSHQHQSNNSYYMPLQTYAPARSSHLDAFLGR